MAYLQDNQYLFTSRRKKSISGQYLILLLVVILVIFLLRKAFKTFSYTVAVPVISFEHVVERGMYGLTHSKSDLLRRIESLEAENSQFHSKLISYSLLENENKDLKDSVLVNTSGIIAAVVGKPGKSQYDTLLIESAPGARVGMKAYSISGVPLGMLESTTSSGGTVNLYSSPGVETDADILLANTMESTSLILRGRGGGAFEAIASKDIDIPVGSLAISPGLFGKPMAEVVKIVARDDTKDQIIYLRSIVNFQYLRYIILTE